MQVFDPNLRGISCGLNNCQRGPLRTGTTAHNLHQRFGFHRVINPVLMHVSRDHGCEPRLAQRRQPEPGPHATVGRIAIKRRAVVVPWQSPQWNVADRQP